MASPSVAIMRVVVVTPERFLGEVVGDLVAREGDVKNIAPVGELQGILAFAPIAELHDYPDDLERMTRGQARYQITFSHFQTDGEDTDDGAPVPSPLQPNPTGSLGAAADWSEHASRIS